MIKLYYVKQQRQALQKYVYYEVDVNQLICYVQIKKEGANMTESTKRLLRIIITVIIIAGFAYFLVISPLIQFKKNENRTFSISKILSLQMVKTQVNFTVQVWLNFSILYYILLHSRFRLKETSKFVLRHQIAT